MTEHVSGAAAPPTKQHSLDTCAQEPIRIPGGIQPHGALILLGRDNLELLQASSNFAAILGLRAAPVPTCALDELLPLGDDFAADIRRWNAGSEAYYLRNHRFGDRLFHVSGHRAKQGVILEFEAAANDAATGETLYPILRSFLDQTERLATVEELSARVAEQVRELTGFNRVMIYRFDPEWNGTVIAEDGDGVLPSYLDLRFPSSDIPAQARELYRLNRLRLIPTASYTPVAMEPLLCPADNEPLDMSFAALRSVSPVHLEYMRNMQTQASMSISVVVGDQLWGLISCHHNKEKRVDAHVRAACDFLGRVVAQQIDARQRAAEATERLRLHRVQTELVAHLARAKTYQAGLVEYASLWLGVVNAAGAAVVTEGNVLTAGVAPNPEAVTALAQWLFEQKIDQVFSSDTLSAQYPPAKEMADVASGIVAVPVSRLHVGFIIWFRPEVVRTVTWGGNPRDEKEIDSAGRLHPRLSFESWKEQVRLRAVPWREAELLSAVDFRSAVIDFVLQRAEERAALTEELQRSNKELEAFSYSISHDLRAPFRHIAGYAQLLSEEEPTLKPLSHHYLEGIASAARSAGQLVDDLLHFSQLGRASLRTSQIDMRKVIEEVRQSLDREATERAIEWDVGDMPNCWGDGSLIRQALFNLVENAVKYTRGKIPARIKVAGAEREHDIIYTVQDNGVGFDMAYIGKLFQVFHRLHRPEDFEGTGIGLALTKRIIDRHGGTIQARGVKGEGATFSFTLPKKPKEIVGADA